MRPLLFMLALLVAVPSVLADKKPIRRAAEESFNSRRYSGDETRRSRRAPEGQKRPTIAEQKKKEQAKVIHLTQAATCGTRDPGPFRDQVLGLRNPSDTFNVEVWGNRQKYYTQDEILYYLRANRTAYVTLFWVGPEGSVFIPFTNVKIEADRDHMLDPRNIIVEPVGLERWRVIATLEPHFLPCRSSPGGYGFALEHIKHTQTWAAGLWDVRSYRRTRFDYGRRR